MMRPAYPRIASLDGIRALAVGTVIACHLAQRFPLRTAILPPIDGVQIFFVLSGFLITLLLLREQADTGEIDLPSFYKRRILRILPPFYIYLAFVGLLCVCTAQAIPWGSLLSAGLFVSNVDPHGASLFTSHVWSLAVEEQFYLLWPLLLVLLLRHGGRRRASQAAVALILLSPVFRIAFTVFPMGALSHHQAVLLPTRMDSLFSGCLIALLIENKRFERLYGLVSRYWWLAPVFLLLVSPFLRLGLGNAYTFTVGYTLESLAAAYFVLWATRNPMAAVGRMLNWKPLVLVGLASYSIYLYQMPLIQAGSGITWDNSPERIVFAVFVAGLLSFYLIEQPIAQLRRKLAERSAKHTQPDVSPLEKSGKPVHAA